MASIAEKELREYSQRHIFRENELDYKVLSVPELSQANYRRWHQQEIKKLMKDSGYVVRQATHPSPSADTACSVRQHSLLR